MRLMVSLSYPVIDAQTHAECLARDALFRTADGPYCLYMASKGQVEGEERIVFLDCRNALPRLNQTPDAPGRRSSKSSFSGEFLGFPNR